MTDTTDAVAVSLAFAAALRNALEEISPTDAEIETANRAGFDYDGVLEACDRKAEEIENLLRYTKSEETSPHREAAIAGWVTRRRKLERSEAA
jgi:hypothetical protein